MFASRHRLLRERLRLSAGRSPQADGKRGGSKVWGVTLPSAQGPWRAPLQRPPSSPAATYSAARAAGPGVKRRARCRPAVPTAHGCPAAHDFFALQPAKATGCRVQSVRVSRRRPFGCTRLDLSLHSCWKEPCQCGCGLLPCPRTHCVCPLRHAERYGVRSKG